MAATHMAAPPHLESAQNSSTWRVTRSGRKLWYRLTVLQEPERARACGSGPKSTTDRRPVDPPPVIELRIFEGDQIESGKDITFTYNANFFLFATLEHARPVANGRVNTPAATAPPVLTGMFVSGMAYLDRPTEAGYFLFPDLSVRHEGRYKLIFNLYEQTKEDRDKDGPSPHQPHRTPQSPTDLDESFDHRLKVESRPFSVYSAKKFPGLTESTVLSRTISEQGCRVRIRRDVRMRRREGKPAAGNDYEAKQKEEYERRQRTQTPEIKPDPYRARSLSNSSVERTPYPDPYRRSSVVDYHQQATAPPPPTYGPAPPTPTSAGGHLHFGQSSGPQYPPPRQQYAPPPPPQSQVSPMTPKQHQYPPPHPQRSYQAPPQYTPLPAVPAPVSIAPPSYSLERPSSEPHQYSIAPRDSNDSSRRPSAGSYPAPPACAEPHPASNYPAPPSNDAHPASNYHDGPSTESHSGGSYPSTPSAECHPASSDFSRSHSMKGELPKLCPVLAPILDDPDRSNTNTFTLPPPSVLATKPQSHSSLGKRRFDSSFNSEAQYQPLANGQRQTDAHHFPPINRAAGYDEPTGHGATNLHYRSADGNLVCKEPVVTESLPPTHTPSREAFNHAPYNL